TVRCEATIRSAHLRQYRRRRHHTRNGDETHRSNEAGATTNQAANVAAVTTASASATHVRPATCVHTGTSTAATISPLNTANVTTYVSTVATSRANASNASPSQPHTLSGRRRRAWTSTSCHPAFFSIVSDIRPPPPSQRPPEEPDPTPRVPTRGTASPDDQPHCSRQQSPNRTRPECPSADRSSAPAHATSAPHARTAWRSGPSSAHAHTGPWPSDSAPQSEPGAPASTRYSPSAAPNPGPRKPAYPLLSRSSQHSRNALPGRKESRWETRGRVRCRGLGPAPETSLLALAQKSRPVRIRLTPGPTLRGRYAALAAQ